MKYESTRGSKAYRNAPQAIIRGLAEDRGLYVPSEMPKLPCAVEELTGKTYQEIACRIIGAFFDDFTAEELQACIDGAHDSKIES